jgi:general secretion pathway protein B
MSFILDALKKSESERQRKGAPGIADVPLAARKAGGIRWSWIIGALLAVNLVALIALVLRRDAGPEAQPVPIPAQSAAQPQPATNRFADIVADAKRDAPAVTATHTETPKDLASQAIPESKPAVTNGKRATVVDGLPSFNDLRANGTLQLPDLHLDIHVYSSTPAKRFVFINMSRYRENERLTEGPEVREITPDGVILEHLGTRFLLPRE